MSNFKRKRLTSVMSVLLVLTMVFGNMFMPIYARQADVAEKATESAIIVSPDQLAMDGSKSYVIFTVCVWEGHTYGIGPDASATEDLGISREDRVPGSIVDLARNDLGWTIRQTGEGVVIENDGCYLTVSDDEGSLVISNNEKVSGLTINSDGRISLADKATETVYLQCSSSEPEPHKGQQFKVTNKSNNTVFYFAEIQEKQEEPDYPEGVLFPTLLPQEYFRAEIVSPDHVYGDDQYVIFTVRDGQYYAINGEGKCSSTLALTEDTPAAGVRLTSPDQDVLWTVNNNREKPAEGGYYKYIRSSATNKYLTLNDALLDENIHCDFFLEDKNGDSALIASEDGHYVTLDGDKFGSTADRASASRFYFAKLLQKEQQTDGDKTAIPKGTLLRLVDWKNIKDGKQYAIISATEFNKLHYAISGNGRLARYGADDLTNNSLCPNENVNGVYSAPCEAGVGDIFYTNGQDILWTASGVSGNQVEFRNTETNLYLKLSSGVAAAQTAGISKEQASVQIEPAEGKAYAYLSDGTNYLGIWQYICVAVSEDAPERCAFYLAEVASEDLPETKLTADEDDSTFSFGGIYSIYQGSQHLLNDGTGVENFIMMNDDTGSFKPSGSEYDLNGKSNFLVTYCADYESGMPVFTAPGKYEAVSLADYDGFTAEQKAALGAIVPNCYPYVSMETFLSNLKAAGFAVSDNCGTDEIMAGIQSAIYSVTNPRDDGQTWGYESSDGWAHNSYEVNKPADYVSDRNQAKSDVNTVRDYLLNLTGAASAVAEGGFIEVTDKECFAIVTEINGEKWALSYEKLYSYSDNFSACLLPYDPDDARQWWYEDENGSLQWYVNLLNPDENIKSYLDFSYYTSSSNEYNYLVNDKYY